MTTQQFYYQQMLRQNTLRAYAAAMKNYTAAAGTAEDTPTKEAEGICFTVINVAQGFESLQLSYSGRDESIAPAQTLQYRINNGSWTNIVYFWDGNFWQTDNAATGLKAGDKVYFRTSTKLDKFSFDLAYNNYSFGSMPGNTFKVSGNIMDLIDPTGTATTLPESAGCSFFKLFAGLGLTDASELELPDNTTSCCYSGMFAYCTSLTAAPELPATTMTYGCYNGMFTACSSLTVAPALPATTLAEGCYSYMFEYCSTLVNAPALPATTLANACYGGMFIECAALTLAPDLPATDLMPGCYTQMFNGCTSLTTPPVMSATTLAGTYIPPGEEDPVGCCQLMFFNCTSLTSAPDLLATTLTEQCYMSMFEDCFNLNTIHVKFTEWKNGATENWAQGVQTTSGTFTCPTALGTSETISRGSHNCPENWTVVNP